MKIQKKKYVFFLGGRGVVRSGGDVGLGGQCGLDQLANLYSVILR